MSSARYSSCAASRSRAEVCSASSPRSSGTGSSPSAELAQQRAVDDEIGVAADRRGEVAVRRAREPRVAEVARVVARLLERAQDERRERLPPAARLLDVLGDPLRDLARELRRRLRRERLGHGRRRDAEVGRASRAAARSPAGRAARGRGRAPRGCGRRGTPRRARSRGSSAPRRACARAARPRATRPRRGRRRSENATSGVVTSSAPRAKRRARSAVASSPASSSCSRISGGASRRSRLRRR